MLLHRRSTRHRKSASWSAMFPSSASASSSTRTDHSCQPAILRSESNDYSADNADKSLTDISASTCTSTRSSSSDSVQSINASHWKTKRSMEENATARSGLSSLLKHKASPFPLPSVFCISRSAVNSENAQSNDIVQFVYPETIPIERISMLAGILESLVRIVDQELIGPEDAVADVSQPPCRVVGLGTFKVAISNRDLIDDVALAIIASPTYATEEIVKCMCAMHNAVSDLEVMSDQLGAYLSPTIRVLFNPDFNDDDEQEICKF